MKIEKLKQKMLSGINREYEENCSDFEKAVEDYGLTEMFEYSGIKVKIDWRKKLEKHYQVKINSFEDISILSDENADVSIVEDTPEKLVFEVTNAGGDWQLPIDYKIIISENSRRKIDLGQFENDFREYTNYINEIELIAAHLGYDVTNLKSEELENILNNYIDPVLVITSTSAESKELVVDYNELIKNHHKNALENIFNLDSFDKLPKDIGEKLYSNIVEKVQQYPFN